jgi:hypothetical protein
LKETRTCPLGCVVEETSIPFHSYKKNQNLEDQTKEINNTTHFSLLNTFSSLLVNSDNLSLNDRNLMSESEPNCVLEVCGRHSMTDCLNHTEDICFPTEDGCRLI